MSTFNIKRGDLLPVLVADLTDRAGNPIDLSATGTTVTATMADGQGNVVFSRPADIIAEIPGRVRYQWVSGDTDVTGTFYAEFHVDVNGVAQTFPTAGYTVIAIVPDLTSLGDFSITDLNRLRRMTGEGSTSRIFTDDEMLEALTRYAVAGVPNFEASALDVWREKVAAYAGLVDIDESGSGRKLSQLYRQALNQVTYYEGLINVAITRAQATRPTRARAAAWAVSPEVRDAR